MSHSPFRSNDPYSGAEDLSRYLDEAEKLKRQYAEASAVKPITTTEFRADLPEERRVAIEQGANRIIAEQTYLTRERRARTAADIVLVEVAKANAMHKPFNSHHEGFAIFKEEVDELWDEIKADNHELAIAEAVQAAAMAIRFLVDCGKWDVRMGGASSGHTDPEMIPILVDGDGNPLKLF